MPPSNNQTTYPSQNPSGLAAQVAPPAGVDTPNPNQTSPVGGGQKTAKQVRDQRASVQNHLMFSEIRDNIVLMRDGSLRMVIMASALNFDLKSQQEQDAIEFAYQGFLNGLHFPIQIVIRSRKLDLDSYIDKLQNLQADQDNPLLADLMGDYVLNIRSLLEEVNIMKKEFYVVVPFFVEVLSKENIFTKFSKLLKPSQDVSLSASQFENNKRDLLQRTNLVAQGLAQLGVRAVVLSTQELTELFYSAYNIEEAQNQTLINTSDLEAPVVERGRQANKNGPTGVQAAPSAGPVGPSGEPDDLFAAAAKRGQAAGVEASAQSSQAAGSPGQVGQTQPATTAPTESQATPATAPISGQSPAGPSTTQTTTPAATGSTQPASSPESAPASPITRGGK